MNKAIKVTVTGGAGQISYSLLFRIAAGELFGAEQPVILQCLELPVGIQAMQGVAMELADCAFPLLEDVVITDDVNAAFKDSECAFLVGARPRGKGMERADLLQANAEIFSVQGRAINANANSNIKVLVVGNPANTNALITAANAPDINPRQIHAMMRLDHNRALAQIAKKLNVANRDVNNVIIWGNHSAKQYPDLFHASANGEAVGKKLEQDWVVNNFIPTVQKRGAAIIEARGFSSAASAANAAIDHMRDWFTGTKKGQWTTMGVPSDGSYGIAPGVVFGFPCTCKNGDYEIVQNLAISDFSQKHITHSEQELREERDAVATLL